MSFQAYRPFMRYLRRNSSFISRSTIERISDSVPSPFSRTFSSQLTDLKIDNHGKKYLFRRVDSEKDVEARGDADVFGNLRKDLKIEEMMKAMPEEEDDIIRKDFYNGKIGKRRLSTKQYADMIKQLLADNKLVEALDVLEVKMLKEDRVQPENYIYNILIGGCAKVGYTKKAFKLYNDMKKRDLKVTGATYTSLFNSCSLSPSLVDGLKRAHHLRGIITEKQILLNLSNYHAMMKAFGRCGDLVTVFSIVDEMVSKGIPLKPATFCFLLQACLSDKQDGFRHSLMVWRKMREKGVKPTIYCYNLMLRSARDCDIGDMLQITQDMKRLNFVRQLSEVGLLNGENDNSVDQNFLPNISEDCTNLPAQLPNLLAVKPVMGSVVSMNRIVKPKHRLMLLGGLNGIMDQMKLDGVEADVKTATLLLDLVPSTCRDEQELIEKLRKSGISLDIDFCNMLIKKRCFRLDFIAAKDVSKLISELRLIPNLMTFGVLSLSCRTTKDALQFLSDLNSSGLRLNMEIMGGLLCAARHSWNIRLTLLLMDEVEEEELKVSSIFYQHLWKIRDFTAKQIQLKDQGMQYHHKIDDPDYMETYSTFLDKLEKWSKTVVMDEKETQHPWKQYKKTG